MDETPRPPAGPDDPQQSHDPRPQASAPDPFQQPTYGSPPPGAVPTYVVARQPTNPWKVATIILGTLLALALLVITGLVLWIVFAWVGPGYYAYSELDEEAELMTTSGTALEEPCDRFADLARDLPIFTAGPEAAPAVAELGAAAHDVADASRTVDATDTWWDPESWAGGWDDLGDALEDFATRVADDPDARLEVPRWSGGPATITLGYDGPEGCEIPAVVSALDPDTADELYVEAW